MLLRSYKIARILPCMADPEKIRVIAEVSGEIHEVFPYLNAILKSCIYNHPDNTLTIKKDQKLITLHAYHITLAKVEDEQEAEALLEWLQSLINETYEKTDQVQPNYSKGTDLKALDIYKLLPGTNCKQCGEPACLAFSVKLVAQEVEIHKVQPSLFRGIPGQATGALRTPSCHWLYRWRVYRGQPMTKEGVDYGCAG